MQLFKIYYALNTEHFSSVSSSSRDMTLVQSTNNGESSLFPLSSSFLKASFNSHDAAVAKLSEPLK